MGLYYLKPEETLEYLRKELKRYVATAKLKALVLGISGGIDSAIVAAIARPVCDELGIPLIGLSLPSNTNSAAEIDRANKIGAAYCTKFETILIDPMVNVLSETCKLTDVRTKEDKIRRGNIKARVRMILLYDAAQAAHGCVLSTDNLTEYYLGFWTLHGDVGDIGMIQNIWKTDVYRISNYVASIETNAERKEALMLCIEAVPTDGLGITSSDLEQIGAGSYAEVDKILESYVHGYESGMIDPGGPVHPVIARYMNSQFKRNNPYNFYLASR